MNVQVQSQLKAFQLSKGVYKRQPVNLDGNGSLKFEESIDVDASYAIVRLVHTLVSANKKRVPYVSLVSDSWFIDLKLFDVRVDWKITQIPKCI